MTSVPRQLMRRSRVHTQRGSPITGSLVSSRGLADRGLGEILAGIDHAADHHPEGIEERLGRIEHLGIVDVEQEQAVLRIEQDQPRRRPFDHLRHFDLSNRAASTAP